MFTTGTPPKTENWTIQANNRIVYASINSINGITGKFLHEIKTFLISNGYTVKGSSDGASASMSGIDYWTSASACTTKGAFPNAIQSWIILVDGQGVDILLTHQGAVEGSIKISFSNGALFVLAGTVTFQPTATDETSVFSSAEAVGTTTSGDRVWHGWVSSDAKMFRILTCRLGVAGAAFGVEKYTILWDSSQAIGKCWGFSHRGDQLISNSGGGFNALTGIANTRGGILRYNTTNVLVGYGSTLGSGTSGYGTFGTEKPEAQGSNTHILCGMLIVSSVAGFGGVFGLITDSWFSFNNATATLGDMYGSSDWVALSPSTTTATGGVLWPWDGSSYFLTA